MNFKKLVAWLTLSATAATPLAIAQNPTILQGNYISNVFGNSNFVLNPNAQTSTANVTVAGGTGSVTRSTTTPLVATSEFLVSLNSGVTATWSTRTFDQGMKGQNCEARFTYRGFSAGTTTAQIVQGSNVVAQLVLTPSTDPRIASINFPCGDLSTATSFRLSQTTAAMTGTNELGGIYVGLATNMANVAQAEFVGGGEWTTTSVMSRSASTLQTTFAAFTGGSGNYNTAAALGKATSAGSDSTITFPYLPAGEYQVVTNLALFLTAQTQAGECKFAFQEIDSNTYNGQTFTGNTWTSGTIYTASTNLTARFNFTSGGQRRFRIVSLNAAAGTNAFCVAQLDTTSNKAGIYVYRFPSSSELVVKPETQNVFGGVNFNGAGFIQSQSITASTWAKLTYQTNITRNPYGKAFVETNNDISVTIKSLPVGTYRVVANGLMRSIANGSGNMTSCAFGLSDSATPTNTIIASHANAVGDATSTTQDQYVSTAYGVFTNTSVQDKTFYVVAKRTQGAGSCIVGTNSSDYPFVLSVEPLDQPSNSALYVQGPVLGANTGAAIAAGYQGEEKIAYATTTSTVTQDVEVDVTGASITLDPGVWELQYSASVLIERTPASTSSVQCRLRIRDSANNVESSTESGVGLYNTVSSIAWNFLEMSKTKRINLTTTKTFKLSITSSVTNTVGNCFAYTGSTTGGITGNEALTYIRAVKIN